ncbi:hypothetical protein HNY73_016880 [Argiope bruennichi]|uniref:Uncharacterized protein n=1 Tax=Argiope bruennichi TaxID=94029 RepID=A0A8T0EP59_ARGBR|nr:hypothetical protein HNY73_016880 [Argiope bruennichi]
MKYLAYSLVLCYVIAIASSQPPNYQFYKQYFIPNGGQPQVVGGGQPAYGGGYNPNNYYGGGQQPNYYNGGCQETSCPSFCTIGTGPDGCPECVCIQY